MKKGFTLIELLVAMVILSILVVAVSQLFYQCTVAWEGGHRRTQTAMVGRAIVGYVTEDVSLAVWGGGLTAPTAPSGVPRFASLDGTNGRVDVIYTYNAGNGDILRSGEPIGAPVAGTPLYESSDLLKITDFDVEFDLSNALAVVSVEVATYDKGRGATNLYSSRTILANRNRYVFD